MPEFPSEQERKALCRLLLTHVASKGTVEKALILYLFETSIKAGERNPHISEGDVLSDCKGGPSTENAVAAAMSRLRANCEYFFAYDPIGREQTYKVVFQKKEYLPQYEFNHPPPLPDDLVKNFWGSYYLSDRPIRIFFPDLPHDAARLSYTPTSIVQAVITIFDVLQRSPKVKFTATPLKPTEPIPNNDEDIIVIGTPESMPQLIQLEAGCPLQSGIHTSDNFPKANPPGADERHLPTKHPTWALISRTNRIFQGRVATSISANAFPAFPPIASYLTQHNDLNLLAHMLGSKTFATEFQVLFDVAMLTLGDIDIVRSIKPAQAVQLDQVIH